MAKNCWEKRWRKKWWIICFLPQMVSHTHDQHIHAFLYHLRKLVVKMVCMLQIQQLMSSMCSKACVCRMKPLEYYPQHDDFTSETPTDLTFCISVNSSAIVGWIPTVSVKSWHGKIKEWQKRLSKKKKCNKIWSMKNNPGGQNNMAEKTKLQKGRNEVRQTKYH